jgi:RNA polymerase sigma factor (sigma-70 family)
MFLSSKPDPESDEQLIASFRQTGDLKLVGTLFSRYASLIYGVCLKYLKDRDEAKDTTMQLFEKLGDKLKNHEISSFRSWLYVTARNECLMLIRSKKGKFTKEFDQEVVENALLLHPEDDTGLETDLSRLAECIETLTGEQKRCVSLFYLEEKCYKDIAAETGYEMTKVKSYIQNGKRNLKLCMEKHGQVR